ncbi:MAG: TonB C-terminal domain-containing protein [Nitrospira sp.]|nr:TonB C-terminal domain-containing protein [Nitrospira sp.]
MEPPPTPPVKDIPVVPPAPPIKEIPAVPPPQVKASVSDIMKGLELPPDAPKLGDFTPSAKPAKKQFKLPDVPVVSGVQESAKNEPDVNQQPLLTEDLNKDLEEELRNIKNIDLPQDPAPAAMPKPAPQVEAKAPSVKAVDAALKISGMAPGSNAYLGRVRQRISSFWTAPPVDITGQAYVVVVRFRLHRDGSVTKVEIERSSGNEYYDLAGKRAVLSAKPLPAFPPELQEAHFDAHFTFSVGDSQG